MDFRKVIIVSVYVLFSFEAFSQINPSTNDTLKEIIVFEYDTIYLEPDTIRLTKTVIDTAKMRENENKKLNIKHSSFYSNKFLAAIIPNSVGVYFASSAKGKMKEKYLSDSLSCQANIDYSISFLLNYNIKKYLLSFEFGYIPIHEQFLFKRDYYSTVNNSKTPESSDSLLINKEYTADYYSNYLNFSVLFRRELQINEKFSFGLGLGCLTDYLLGYNQGNTNIPKSTIRKFDLSIAFTSNISYKPSRNFEVYLSPFYQHSLFDDNKYPYSSFQKAGIGLGFNLFL